MGKDHGNGSRWITTVIITLSALVLTAMAGVAMTLRDDMKLIANQFQSLTHDVAVVKTTVGRVDRHVEKLLEKD